MVTVVTPREASLVSVCLLTSYQVFSCETDSVRCAAANCGTWLKQAAQVPRHLLTGIGARSFNCFQGEDEVLLKLLSAFSKLPGFCKLPWRSASLAAKGRWKMRFYQKGTKL